MIFYLTFILIILSFTPNSLSINVYSNFDVSKQSIIKEKRVKTPLLSISEEEVSIVF